MGNRDLLNYTFKQMKVEEGFNEKSELCQEKNWEKKSINQSINHFPVQKAIY